MLSDIGMERAVLAGIAQFSGDGLAEIQDIVNVFTFTDPSNQMLFKCMGEATRQNAKLDIAALISAAKELNLYETVASSKKDIEYINSLFSFPINLENLRGFAKKLAKLEFARKAQLKHKEAYDALSKLKGSESIDEIIGISERPVFDILLNAEGKSNEPVLIAEGMEEYVQYLLNNEIENVGIPTPWPIYNAAIGGGFRTGGVNMIGARPKVGKSTLSKELIMHVTTNLNIPILYLDTEMEQKDTFIRSLASSAKIPVNILERGKFNKSDLMRGMFINAYEELKKNKLFFYKNVPGYKFEDILSIIRRWIIKHVGFNDDGTTKRCLIVYDYFKLMDKSDLNSLKEYEALGYQISTFTDFAKQFNFATLAFVQLNRQEEISQSDRLRWLCHSFSSFIEKTSEMIGEDGGISSGNRRMYIHDARFGPKLNAGEHINFLLNGDMNQVYEIGLKETQNEGNEVV
jgi:replicative DNA helicase